jgi:hypothetical protein
MATFPFGIKTCITYHLCVSYTTKDEINTDVAVILAGVICLTITASVHPDICNNGGDHDLDVSVDVENDRNCGADNSIGVGAGAVATMATIDACTSILFSSVGIYVKKAPRLGLIIGSFTSLITLLKVPATRATCSAHWVNVHRQRT